MPMDGTNYGILSVDPLLDIRVKLGERTDP
jgi:hypothetical protein